MHALGLRVLPNGGAKVVVETEVWSGKVAHLRAAAAVEWRVRQLVGLVWPLAGFLTVSPERKWVLGQSRAARGGGGWSGGRCTVQVELPPGGHRWVLLEAAAA
eukprot:COSAG01_NODE_1751_length_9323_cov_5.197507_14_plen_103_part_00